MITRIAEVSPDTTLLTELFVEPTAGTVDQQAARVVHEAEARGAQAVILGCFRRVAAIASDVWASVRGTGPGSGLGAFQVSAS